jgi:hypothetical protein
MPRYYEKECPTDLADFPDRLRRLFNAAQEKKMSAPELCSAKIWESIAASLIL